MIANIFKQFLGDPAEHNEETGQMSFDCPSCAEHGKGHGKHKLAVNYHKNIFRCWVCGFENNMHGKIPYLIKRYGNKRILKEYFLVRPDSKFKKERELIPTKIDLPKGFVKLTPDNSNHFKFDSAYKYLKARGITDEIIDYYNIGYTVVGKYHDRIILPSYDEFGDVNYFVARAWDKWKKPKYLNPEAEKQLVVFNENKINWDATIYLVEGAFDHIVIPNSIPLLGKNLSEKLKQLLYHNSRANIVIVLDEDAYDDAIRLYKDLNSGRLYNRIKLCTPPFERLGNNGIVKLLRNSYRIPESKLY
jgi:hypothetical protein